MYSSTQKVCLDKKYLGFYVHSVSAARVDTSHQSTAVDIYPQKTLQSPLFKHSLNNKD